MACSALVFLDAKHVLNAILYVIYVGDKEDLLKLIV